MKKRATFSGSIGFVLAAAGSAVGLGNIWRFPYLAAKDGGGLFLVVYLILVLTFGFTLLTTEVALGRKTAQGPLTAYKSAHPKFGFLGVLACIVPIIILPYYCVIGGWVFKYLVDFVSGNGIAAAQDDYFGGFITSTVPPIVYMLVFLGITAFIIAIGVEKGIELLSKFMMPILLVLIIGISLFSLTLSFTEEVDGVSVTRTGLQGLSLYVIPNFDGLTPQTFFSVVMDAMGQLFYSISVAMGIMVAYGSYSPKNANLGKNINHIEIFDTLVAVLAGLMIIPAVFTFSGKEGMAAGPGLMFVALPKVFKAMGTVGTLIGIIFFVTVSFAAITSSISILEAIVASFMDKFHWKRRKATLIVGIYAVIAAVVVCLGYNMLYFEVKLPNGAIAQILDIMDYVSNNVMMPIVAIFTCILFGWIIGPKYILDEVTLGGEKFGRQRLYVVMLKFIAPAMLILLLVQSFISF